VIKKPTVIWIKKQEINNMIPESKLKADCTPDIIKKMVELAEGFEYYENEEGDKYYSHKKSEWIPILVFNPVVFPLLIHRAVEGWNKNKKEESILKEIIVYDDSVKLIEYKESREGGFDPFAIVMKKFKNYQPSSFTPCECACLHCLIEVLG
jgi:hypothetical protein